MSWYAKNTSSGQGLVIDEKDGRTVAVAYDQKDTPLLAASEEMLSALEWFIEFCTEDELCNGSAEAHWLKSVRAVIAKAKGEA